MATREKQAPERRTLTLDELEQQEATELPSREAMSIISPSFAIAGVYPVHNPIDLPIDPPVKESPPPADL